MNAPASLLVAGAGPTGLALALQAHAHGARVRIVERRTEAFRPSRALILHARTLEALRPLGVAEALLARANPQPEVELHAGNHHVRVRLGPFTIPDTAFPHLTLIRQMDLEAVLADALAERGVTVERGVELIDTGQDGAGPWARLHGPGGEETVCYDAVIGCDGQHSTVRERMKVAWRGKPYPLEILLADADLQLAPTPGVAHASIGRDGLLLVFPLGEHAPWRILATRQAAQAPDRFGQQGHGITGDGLQALIDTSGFGARITGLRWSASYRVQRRIASRFREGMLFIAGDAAHAFSPATGQGMNTGLQDAINLGWKLALAPSARAPDALLDSYSVERRFAVQAVSLMTHVAFWTEAATGTVPGLLRGRLFPLVAPLIPFALRRDRIMAEGIRLLSGLRLAYPRSPISRTEGGRWGRFPAAGHRMPDLAVEVDGHTARLHGLLARPGMHVLLQRDAPDIGNAVAAPLVHVHRLDSLPGRGVAIIRPDGYVGYRAGDADANRLQDWLRGTGAL
jgi:2-polyprenyl-6-methoxyphenol hydroxylase-like FAD-dependent oxidoreductase